MVSFHLALPEIRSQADLLIRDSNMKTRILLYIAALAATVHAAGESPDVVRVKAVEDAICAITRTATTGGVFSVDFTLRPTAKSDIRCRIDLPHRERWNGRLWGIGNSSMGGSVPDMSRGRGDPRAASVTTDLGTWRYVHGDMTGKAVPDEVLHDLYWRATHLMTVYGKRFVKAYYGRDVEHAYFRGGSRGGNQGMSEAMRFPADYDGILVGVPSSVQSVTCAQLLNLYRQTHDAQGRPLVTREQLRILADAPIEYMKNRDPKPYAGKILANPFFSEADIDGFLAVAAAKDPALGEPALKERLKRIFTGVRRNGRIVCHGFLPGTDFSSRRGRNFESKGGVMADLRYRRLGDWKCATWEDFEEEFAMMGSFENACSTDLAAFRDRGGKMIVNVGLEDQSTPAPETIAWYEGMAERMGGIEKTQRFCRLFLMPGHAHGGGFGRIGKGGGYNAAHYRLLEDWVENGTPPETYPYAWPAEKLTFPLPPYPLTCYQDDSGAWKTRRLPDGIVRHPDAYYMQSTLEPWKWTMPKAKTGGGALPMNYIKGQQNYDNRAY